jgi:hypothetical protein
VVDLRDTRNHLRSTRKRAEIALEVISRVRKVSVSSQRFISAASLFTRSFSRCFSKSAGSGASSPMVPSALVSGFLRLPNIAQVLRKATDGAESTAPGAGSEMTCLESLTSISSQILDMTYM